jgi:hypothetical protein
MGVETETAVRRLRVRTGVSDLARRVQPDQPVADARRRRGLPRVPRRREGAVRDHLGQVVGGGQIVEFELAGGPRGGQVGVPPDHRDDLAEALFLVIGLVPQPHRDRLVPGGGVAIPNRVALAPDPALGVGDVQMGHLRPADDLADLVVLVRGRRGRRPDLGDAEERPGLAGRSADRHPEQQVGEGQVGQQLPIAGQPVQVVDVGGAEGGVFLDQITQR